MAEKGISRRQFLRGAAWAAVSLAAASCAQPAPTATVPPAATATAAPPTAVPPTATTVPPTATVVQQLGEPDLSKPEQVAKALEAEGAQVRIGTWKFSGLMAQVIPDQFAAYTKAKYGVPVKLLGCSGADCDIWDNEEQWNAMALAGGGLEPVDQERYRPLLGNVNQVEEGYLWQAEPKVEGGGIYGVLYQGFEWLQAILRKDKVDLSNYRDWTDLARPELKGRGVTYPFTDKDMRSQVVFMGLLNALIKQGIVKGELWSEGAWEEGLQWWKENMEGQILEWGDMGNSQSLRSRLQAGDCWWAGLWGVYTRELLGTDWNQKDSVLQAFYPASGMPLNRQTCKVAKGGKHPVAARVLIDWMVSTEFQHAGWYKEKEGVEAVNRWNITQDKYLVVHAGGVNPAQRALTPDWAKPYYPADPASLMLKVNWEWWSAKTQWITQAYSRIVRGV